MQIPRRTWNRNAWRAVLADHRKYYRLTRDTAISSLLAAEGANRRNLSVIRVPNHPIAAAHDKVRYVFGPRAPLP